MLLKELREKSTKELHKLLAKSREELRAIRFSINAKQQKDIRSSRKVKKTIARILTIQKQQKPAEQLTNQAVAELPSDRV